MKIKAVLGYVKEGNVIPFYLWSLRSVIRLLYYKDFGKKNAVKVIEEDWDYLIILDACRYDIFKEVVDEKANYIISGGSNTQEWLEWNFNIDCKEVVYIAGNPHLASVHLKKTFGFNPFYSVKEVWDYGWDNSLKTVPPKEVTIAALDALKSFPKKRMIIHYNQPHHPFLSDKELTEIVGGTWHTLEGGLQGRGINRMVRNLVRQGVVSTERLERAYKENLRIVMREVKKLKEELPGRVILTADHGEHLGKYGIYGHYRGLRTEELVKVPWIVLKDEEKKIDEERVKIKEGVRKLKRSGKL